MATNNTHNLYSPVDVVDRDLTRTERVFISHRSFDKPLATAVAALFEGLGVHYWFDREDEDTHRAASLGMAGEQALVHAIERVIKHSIPVLGILSDTTLGAS